MKYFLLCESFPPLNAYEDGRKKKKLLLFPKNLPIRMFMLVRIVMKIFDQDLCIKKNRKSYKVV